MPKNAWFSCVFGLSWRYVEIREIGQSPTIPNFIYDSISLAFLGFSESIPVRRIGSVPPGAPPLRALFGRMQQNHCSTKNPPLQPECLN